MNADIKVKWVAALRSGKYRQGEGYLQKDGRFCCLGVLCDLLDDKDWRRSWDEQEAGSLLWGGTGLAIVPDDGLARAGIHPHKAGHLMTMNDTGESFARIADWIEKNL